MKFKKTYISPDLLLSFIADTALATEAIAGTSGNLDNFNPGDEDLPIL